MAKNKDDETIEPLDDEEKIKRVLRRIIQLTADAFFGEMILTFKAGRILYIDEKRKRTPEEL